MSVDDPQKILTDDQVRSLAIELAGPLAEFKVLQELGREKFCGIWTGGGGKGWYSEGVTEYFYDIGLMDLLGIRADNGMPAGECFGTSVGALHACAAARANGDKAKYQEAWFAVKQNSDVYKGELGGLGIPGNVATLAFNGPALLDNSPLEKILNRLFENRTFLDLPIPARVTAYCIADDNPTKLTHKIITLKREDIIVDACMASAAMPGIFKYRKYKGRVLVDGGWGANNPALYACANGMTRGFIAYCSQSTQNNPASKFKGARDVLADLPQSAMDNFEDNVHEQALQYLALQAAQGKRPASITSLEPDFDTLSPVEFGKNRWLRDRGYRDAKKKFTKEVILNMLFGPGGMVSL
jgi:predicted acylesterase/phospholipase RssA